MQNMDDMSREDLLTLIHDLQHRIDQQESVHRQNMAHLREQNAHLAKFIKNLPLSVKRDAIEKARKKT